MKAALVFLMPPLLLVKVFSNELTHGRCYGWQMDITCSSSDKIFPLLVMVGAKPESKGCPDIMTLNANSTFERSCCTYDQESCYFPYSNLDASVTNTYFENCIGRSNCTWPIARLDIRSYDQRTCNSSIYPESTTFMVLHYYCIRATEIQSISSSFSRNLVTTLHITAQNYSDNNSTSTGIGMIRDPVTCSVEVSDCSGRVNVTGLDVRLVKVDSACKQTLTFLEDGKNSTIDCSRNSNFGAVHLFLSTTSYFMFVYIDNHTGGYLWLKFETVDKSHNMEIKCGENQSQPKRQCNTVNGTSVNTMTSLMNTEKPQSSVELAVIVSVVIIASITIACIAGVVYLKKRRPEKLSHLWDILLKICCKKYTNTIRPNVRRIEVRERSSEQPSTEVSKSSVKANLTFSMS
ncbi:uncharacterized protein LOC134281917 [Saccostrea cucullata]|uniref:uncharacterized protein LOC134281917 n=1 Tax=Saccostrea cuccullata TaxID=36930 RepID=UPI002ED1BE20